MTQSLPATRARPISITELTDPRSPTPQANRGDTSGRPIRSPRPEKDFVEYTRTLPAPHGEQLSGRWLEGATEVGREGRRDPERPEAEAVGERSEELERTDRNTCRMKASAAHGELATGPARSKAGGLASGCRRAVFAQPRMEAAC